MVTDTMMEAIDLMIDACSSAEQRKGMESVKEMLGEFDELTWLDFSGNEMCEFVERFLKCEPNI